MKKVILISLLACNFLHASLLDYYERQAENAQAKYEALYEGKVENCTVLEQVLNTQNKYNLIVTGITSCNRANLVYKLYCSGSLISIESNYSSGGTFKYSFTSVKDCTNPSVNVNIK